MSGLHGSSQFSNILNGFLQQSLTQCRSAAEGLSEPLVYTRPEIIGLNPSLSRVDEAQSKTFFILQILMILACKRCCHLLSLSFRRRHSHRPVCKGWCHPAQSHEYLFSSSFGLHKKPLTYCMCCWTNCTTGTSILHHHIILLVVIVYDCINIYIYIFF